MTTQDKGSKPVYGVAFHSPLDLISVQPVGFSATLSPTTKADLLYTQKYFEHHNSSVQLVFQPLDKLLVQGIMVVLDVGSNGQQSSVKAEQLDKILSIKPPKKRPQIVKKSVAGVGAVKKATKKVSLKVHPPVKHEPKAK